MSHFWQSGTITDDDGPYIPGEVDCSWIIAPTGASRIHLIISKLELGGLDGHDHEELQIAVCQDIECGNPVHIPGSPFDEHSEYFNQVYTCLDHNRLWLNSFKTPTFQVLHFLPTLLSFELVPCIQY